MIVSPKHSWDRKGLARTTPRIKSECDHSLWTSCATRHVTMYSLFAKYLIIKPETYQLREPLPKLRFQYVRHYSDSAMHVVIRTGREYQTFWWAMLLGVQRWAVELEMDAPLRADQMSVTWITYRTSREEVNPTNQFSSQHVGNDSQGLNAVCGDK